MLKEKLNSMIKSFGRIRIEENTNRVRLLYVNRKLKEIRQVVNILIN
uniref:Uncharacterized protein n=1 Tax=Podoviridae sp. ctZkC8 TaxID=2825259 RepID=A0A8S5UBG1_9CAUD|nr:MAG TPA: hypothetical protein [Podoviridae sp. ctZkC8]